MLKRCLHHFVHQFLLLCFLSAVVHSEFDESCQDDHSAVECRHPIHVALELTHDDEERAKQLAEKHGLKYINRIGSLANHFVFDYDHQVTHRLHRHKRQVSDQLNAEAEVKWHDAQLPKTRTKRDFNLNHDNNLYASSRSKRSNLPYALPNIPYLPWRDPLYSHQWYLTKGASGQYDMNVQAAWRLGYSGLGVSVSILDDGIQRDHPDILQNYDPLASSDINDNDDDPMPQDNGDNKHGTRCAGEVAAVAGNSHCGVGVAYNASIGGVRMLDGPVSDTVEARSLSLNQQHIDIYSASWGPEDDGRTFDGPGPLARKAFEQGITTGRGGKGNIFVWASGNGGARQDSCSADGYTTSVYTLSISSATFDNHRPWYLEECPSTIASTYSSANIGQPAIVTVDVPSGCTESHTGTSASAPLAAGLIALAIHANPNLTWRDMQHLVLRTANPVPLLANEGWSKNGVGRDISTKFGYGLMDAEKLVRAALVWEPLPAQNKCQIEYSMPSETASSGEKLSGNFRHEYALQVDCADQVSYIEHIHAKVTLKFSRRGDIKITIISPAGTTSTLLPPRPRDVNNSGFHEWPFLSVQQWGEDPRGKWTLIVENVGAVTNSGSFHGWSLVVYGTVTPAQSYDVQHPATPGPNQRQNIPAYQAHAGTDLPAAHLLPSHKSNANTKQADSTAESKINHESTVNVGNCHAECNKQGCRASKSASACFECAHYKQQLGGKNGFKCVSACAVGYYTDRTSMTCGQCKRMCSTCKDADTCVTCAQGLYLVATHTSDVLHYQCVDKCPKELKPDLSNAAAPRCVLPTNNCGAGKFQGEKGCTSCATECAECYGQGDHKCTACAKGHVFVHDVCMKCCAPGDMRQNAITCGECTSTAESVLWGNFTNPMHVIIVLAVLMCVVFLIIFGCLMLKDRHTEPHHPYTKLPISYKLRSSKNGGGGIFNNNNNEANMGPSMIISDSDVSDLDSNPEDEEALFDYGKMRSSID